MDAPVKAKVGKLFGSGELSDSTRKGTILLWIGDHRFRRE